jgi:hypothetical protein
LLFSPDIAFERIEIDSPSGKLVTTKAYFIAHATTHQFRNCEPQLFLPLSEFGLDKVNAWEQEAAKRERNRRERASQLTLFEAEATA